MISAKILASFTTLLTTTSNHRRVSLKADLWLFLPSADDLLRVHSMITQVAGIVDGDLLAVQVTPLANKKPIVGARVNDKVIVKSFANKRSVSTAYASVSRQNDS